MSELASGNKKSTPGLQECKVNYNKLITLIGQNVLEHLCWAHGTLLETHWTEAWLMLQKRLASVLR